MHRTSSTAATNDWQAERVALVGRKVVLRELRVSDAPALLLLLGAPEVARFIATPPPSVEAFERFIHRTTRESATLKSMCFAVTLVGDDTAIGLFQIHEIDESVRIAEWGFALGSAFWGTGVFVEAANLMLAFAFERLGVHRLEARVAVRNGRGGRALQKVGGVPEGVLRKGFQKDGRYLDQVMYAIVANDWRASRETVRLSDSSRVH